MSSSSPCASRRALLLALLTLPAVTQAQTQAPPPTPPELAGLVLRGQGKLSFLGLKVYDIRLWAAAPLGADWTQQPLALELQYNMSLSGAKIAERSLVEMQRQGEIPEAKARAWVEAMTAAFPDVKGRDRLVGRYAPGETARFWLNSQPRTAQLDPEAARWFFGIWLSDKTSEPALRQQLLGR
jgi:hypothetical protein